MNTTFGTRLRDLRRARKLTQARLAARIGDGMTDAHIGDYERGRRLPAWVNLCRIARGLDVKLSELVEGLE